MDFNMVGAAFALGLSAIGAAIGCSIAGMVLHGVMSRVEEGHGKLIGISAMPSSQMIYGFVLMLFLRNATVSGSLSPISAAFIGGLSGLAIMVAAIYQGMCCATAIQATAKQPSVFGKTFVAIGIVESFALFAFVFALLLM
ncbi:MAG: ATP synthase subunit C [Verrucomicrobia bacterium]|nr:ATP synthase subunit C [Verrucomicrobiota bacterium]